jgi:hypothetical protein
MMKKRTWLAGLVVCMAAAVNGAAAQETTTLPTAGEIRAQVEAGQYRPALQNLLRVLALKGQAATAYDRFEMLMLRAECQLQIRETRTALDSLEQARKEGVAKADADKVGAATAMALLVQRSPAMKYTPKTSNGPVARKPIDVLAPESRQEAYKALFEDELATARQAVVRAETAAKLQPVMEAAKAAGSLRALEKAATGDVARSKELTERLASHASLLVSNGVNDLSLRTEAIAARANAIVTTPMPQRDPSTKVARMVEVSHRRGLTGEEVGELKRIVQECGQAVTSAGELARALPSEDGALKACAAEAGTL